MLRVTDLDRSIKFYTEALGMTLIRTRDNPDNKYKLAFLGRVPRLLSLSITTCSILAGLSHSPKSRLDLCTRVISFTALSQACGR